MIKIYSRFFLLLALSLTAATSAYAAGTGMPETEEAAAASSWNEIRITCKGANVRVQNAAGMTLEVYNITGVRIAAYKIDNNDTTIGLNCGKGCYILKLGKIARKISIL